MSQNPVFLFPGFGASDLAIVSNGDLVWWDPGIAMLLGLGSMRLAPNGVDPGPPDGQLLGVATKPQNPWAAIVQLLQMQLDNTKWSVTCLPYDWRMDIITNGLQVANNIMQNVTADNPATLVGHSMGGVVCVVAWAKLVAAGKTNLVRRIISICSPFQGSYLPIIWLNGTSGTIDQLLAIGNLASVLPIVKPAQWTIDFLNALALSWSSFYGLFPSLLGAQAAADPNRALFFNSANYPPGVRPNNNWLQYATFTIQPLLASADCQPPAWVMTCVWGNGTFTPWILNSGKVPIQLLNIGLTLAGDGVVTAGSAQLPGAALVEVIGDHSSIPLGIARNGLLAQLIEDPRAAPSPPPLPMFVQVPISQNVTDPPEADDVSGLRCLTIGG